MVIMFIGVVLIFAESVKMDTGEGFLEYAWGFVAANFGSAAVDSIILLVIIVVFMWFITKDNKPKAGGTGEHH